MLKQHYPASSFIGDNNVIPLIPRRRSCSRITALVIVLALVSLAFASRSTLDFAGQSRAATWSAQKPDAIADFVYFPGLYLNQASEPTEHIQAF